MKKRFVFATLVLLLTAISGFGQGILKGTLTDTKGNALPGGVLLLNGGDRYTVSDIYGQYVFLSVPAGDYNMEVSYMGYETFNTKVTIEDGITSYIDVKLTDAVTSLGTFVIVGDRIQGQAKALSVQKSNTNISNIVSSDQVGRFPDENIGDALKRIPGITMQNDQGEARDIVIRGLAPELNSVTLNGDRIPSAEGDNRRVQMDLIPSDMIQTIEVNKSLTPDMDADAIGGSVNLVTRANPHKQMVSATVAGGYNPIRNTPYANLGLVYGDRFFNNKLGLVLSGSYTNNKYGSNNIEAEWDNDDAGNVFMKQMDIRKYDVQRIRRSVSAALDFDINENNKLEFNAMYNWRDDRENRYRMRIKDIKPIYEDDEETIISGYKGEIRRQTKGGIDNNRNKNTRLESQRVQNYSLKGKHLLGEKVEMKWKVAYSKALEDRPNERYIEYRQKKVEFDKDFGSTEFPLLTPTNELDYEDFSLKEITENHNYTDEDEFTTKVDFRAPLSVIRGQKGRLRFGGSAKIKHKKRDNIFYEYEPIEDFPSLANMETVNWDGKGWFGDGRYTPGIFVDKKVLGNFDLLNPNLFEESVVPEEFLMANYKANENIYSGYLRWDQNINEDLSMIVGVRVENTQINYEANVILDEEELVGTRTVKNSYTNILPHYSLKYDITKNLVTRFAFTTSIARPNYYALSPFVNIESEGNNVISGNPNLKAAYSYNVDGIIEYYFKSIGLVSGGLFYKNINNFIYSYKDLSYDRDKFSVDFPELNNTLVEGETYSFEQKRNGDKVDLFGFEVAFQRQFDFIPGKFWQGLGLFVNYTFTKSIAKGIYNADGELRESVALPGTAPHMVNTSLSWENKVFSFRTSLNFTSGYLDELGGSDFEDRFYDKQLFLDINASAAVTPRIRIFAEAHNLTNQPLRYYQGVSTRMMQIEYYKPRFVLGVKFDLR